MVTAVQDSPRSFAACRSIPFQVKPCCFFTDLSISYCCSSSTSTCICLTTKPNNRHTLMYLWLKYTNMNHERPQLTLSEFACGSAKEPNYRDPEWLREKYQEEDLTTTEMAELEGCNSTTIIKWMERAEIPRDQRGHPSDAKFKNEEWLVEQHWDEEKSVRQIARDLDVPYPTIINWFRKLDVPRRDRIEACKAADFPDRYGRNHHNWREYACLTHDNQGHEQWQDNYKGKKTGVSVHRLVAVAEYGFEAVCGEAVHHVNRVPWDNRPDNLVLLDPISHGRRHTND